MATLAPDELIERRAAAFESIIDRMERREVRRRRDFGVISMWVAVGAFVTALVIVMRQTGYLSTSLFLAGSDTMVMLTLALVGIMAAQLSLLIYFRFRRARASQMASQERLQAETTPMTMSGNFVIGQKPSE